MKLALLGLALMGSATYGMTDMFHTAQTITGNVTALYGAAAEIDPFADTDTRRAQQQKLFAMAGTIEPFATDFGRDGEAQIALLTR